MTVPGTDHLAQIVRPLPPGPVSEWNWASDCLTLINWAYQAVKESGRRDFTTLGAVEGPRVAIGLFADERFVPYFGKPFADLTSEERKRVVELSGSCELQQAFSQAMSQSGAKYHVQSYFPEHRSGEWLKVKRFGLLRARLSMEMGRLEKQTVGEADIPSLKARIEGLDERFDELWTSDKAEAKSLLGTKLDEALGVLTERIEKSIGKLPEAWPAFAAASRIRSEIASLAQDGRHDKARLTRRLDAKLPAASDSILASIAEEYEARDPDLRTLQAMRSAVYEKWPGIEPFVDESGPGYTQLYREAERIAGAAFPSFVAAVESMVDGSATFEERQRQYVDAARLYQRVSFADPRFSRLFSRYSDAISDLRPTPTTRDLVATDGGPTSFGLKLATVAWVERVWAATFGSLPFVMPFVTESIQVSGVQKNACREAPNGGYWCSFHIRLGGSLPFVELLSLMPSRARFVWKDERWAVAELDESRPRMAGGSSGGGTDQLPCGLALGCTAADIGVNGILAGLW